MFIKRQLEFEVSQKKESKEKEEKPNTLYKRKINK